MIPLRSLDTSGALGGSYVMSLRVESWRGGSLLAYDIPVASGYEETDRTLRIPERVSLSVPREKDGVSWAPDYDEHPLAANGQRLRVMIGVAGRGKAFEWLQRGWFVVADSQVVGDSVNVTALGLMALVDEARLVSPFQPTGTLGSTIRALVEPAITVDLTSAPSDRSVPSGMNIDEDRLGGVLDVLDAWGADGYVTPDGVFKVVPVGAGIDSVGLSRLLTLMQVSGESTREGAVNVVVARGTAADGGILQGVAYETTGPKAYSGPFNPLPVPFFYASPLLTSVDECNTAAETVLERLRRKNDQRYEVEMVPNPRILAGDSAVMLDLDGSPTYAIEAIRLPYVADGGSMVLKIRGPV